MLKLKLDMHEIYERCENTAKAQSLQHIVIHADKSFTLYSSEKHVEYKPFPTLKKLHESQDFVRLIMGPFGSGKSTGCLSEIVLQAANMPPCKDGIRRSRWAMIRNTYGELKLTTLKTWMDWFGELGLVKTRVQPPYVKHTFNDGHDTIELELIFLALDREDHIKKLKSAEFTGAYLNEMSELLPSVVETIKGRVGRYPSAKDLTAPYRKMVLADTNPPSTKSYIYRLFEEERPEKHRIFKQPSGLIKTKAGYVINPNAENLGIGIDEHYYLDQVPGNSEEFIKVYCMGEYGSIASGKPVYPEYNDDIHSQPTLEPLPELPLYLGFDFGLTPACVILQYVPPQRIHVLRELVAFDMYIGDFIENQLLPCLHNEFKDYRIASAYGDPSGTAGQKAGVVTAFDLLRKAGIKAIPGRTNEIAPRLNGVKHFLVKLPEGKPAFIVSREGCPTLREGFIGEYRYREKYFAGQKRYSEQPEKNEYSHVHDALQYPVMQFAIQTKAPEKRPSSEYLKPIPKVERSYYASYG